MEALHELLLVDDVALLLAQLSDQRAHLGLLPHRPVLEHRATRLPELQHRQRTDHAGLLRVQRAEHLQQQQQQQQRVGEPRA